MGRQQWCCHLSDGKWLRDPMLSQTFAQTHLARDFLFTGLNDRYLNPKRQERKIFTFPYRQCGTSTGQFIGPVSFQLMLGRVFRHPVTRKQWAQWKLANTVWFKWQSVADRFFNWKWDFAGDLLEDEEWSRNDDSWERNKTFQKVYLLCWRCSDFE